MATAPVAVGAPARVLAPFRALGSAFTGAFAETGRLLSFSFVAFIWVPRVLVRYWKQVALITSEISVGTGALIAGGGTIGVIFMLSFFTGGELGLQGYTGLAILGLQPLSGIVSAFANTREIAPIVAGVALSAQIGCGFTAQLGAMRVSEEIDALEVMAIPSQPYLVTTRVIAALIAVIPLYLVGLFASFIATQIIVVQLQGESAGTYSYYFHLFLPVRDVLYSLFKAVVFATMVTMIHCYYGYNVTGGPEGVGRAAGKALRLSIVSIVIVDVFLTLLLWGANPHVQVSG